MWWRWWWWLFRTLLLRHAEIGGWRGSAQRDGGSPGRAEGGVGGTVSGDGWWSLAWIPKAEASSAQV